VDACLYSVRLAAYTRHLARKLLKIVSMVRVFWGFAEVAELNRFELGI
jgi:hypothetical protein